MLHACEIRPRKDNRGVDLISDALPFGRLRYGEPNAISNAIGDLGLRRPGTRRLFDLSASSLRFIASATVLA